MGWLPKTMIRQTVDRTQFYLSLPPPGRNGKIAETLAKLAKEDVMFLGTRMPRFS
jgi:hypothetical protein